MVADDSVLFREGLVRLLVEKGHEVLDAVGEWGGPLPTPPEVSEAVESRRLINRIRRLLPSPAAH